MSLDTPTARRRCARVRLQRALLAIGVITVEQATAALPVAHAIGIPIEENP
jgi:hypothetical protein